MKRKLVRVGVKVTLFMVCFAVIFLALQSVIVPKVEESCDIANDFYALEENSLEVLFLGASQSFCSIDAQKLTEQYGIPSYDFGASGQLPSIVYYYFQEALKTQAPRMVVVEICSFFTSDEEFAAHPDGQTMAWNYFPMKYSEEKIQSMKEVLGGSMFEAVKYCFFPLLEYHSKWSSLTMADLMPSSSEPTGARRGFTPHTNVLPVTFLYNSDDEGEERKIPSGTEKAIAKITELCRQKGIDIIFFKAPSSIWSRTDAKVMKTYMAEHGQVYLELNDYLEQIGIDPDTDFYDRAHLNASGADKVTDFIARYLQENYHLGTGDAI